MLANPDDITTVNRRQKDGTRVLFTCPRCIQLYNKHMGSIDEGDQLRGYYQIRLKCTKNYKYIFWFTFDVLVTNSFILMKFDVVTGTPMTLKQFRVKLAEQLIGNYCSRKRAGRPRKRPSPPNAPISMTHLPTHSKSTRCVYSTAGVFALLHGENSLCGSAQLVRVILPFASLENKMAVTVLDYGMAYNISMYLVYYLFI